MAMKSELGDRVKLVKQPQPEEVRIYQAAFLQAMYTNQAFHEDDRGKIELPPDPSILPLCLLPRSYKLIQ